MSCEPDGSALPWFSASYSSRTSSAGVASRQRAVPQLQRDLARAGGHAGSVHEAERRLDAHDHHRAGRRRD